MKQFKEIYYIIDFMKMEIRKWLKLFFLGFFLIILVNTFSYIFPYFTIILIDDLIPSKNYDLFIKILILLLVIYIFKELFVFIYQNIFFKIRENIGNKLRLKIFTAFDYLKYNQFEQIESSNRYAYITSDINNIKRIFDQTFIHIFKNLISISIGMFFMLKLLPIFSLCVVLILGIYTFFVLKKESWLLKKEKYLSRAFGNLLNQAMAPLYNFLPIKMYNVFNIFKRYLETAQKDYLNDQYSIFKFKNKLNLYQNSLINIMTVFIFIYCGIKIMNQELTLGKMIGYNFYFGILSNAFLGLINFKLNLQSTIASIVRIKEFNKLEKEKINQFSISLNSKANSICFQSVSFSYPMPKNDFNLKDISFSLKGDEILAIIGDNGSGKSTLIKLILGVYDTYDGKILINNVMLEKYNIKNIRDYIGYVPQDNFFINGSLKDNIILNNKENFDKLDKVMNLCGLSDFISRLNEDCETILKTNENFLSGGYQQRIGLARAYYKKPKILIFDEATSQLDPNFEYEQKELLNNFKEQGIPVIVITHRMSMLSIADKILCLQNGRVVFIGENSDAFKNSKILDFLNKQGIKLESITNN